MPRGRLASFVALAAALLLPTAALSQGRASGGSQPMALDSTSTQMYRQQAVEGHRKHDFSPRTPPTRGHFVYGHWTPYEPPDPSTYPPGSRTHVIVRGDTLWDISGKYYKDNYLWPYVWDANPWVTYPHWIYPGDTLLIPSLMVMPTGGTIEETAQLPSILDGFYPASAGDSAYACGHFVADPNFEFMGEILAAEDDPGPVAATLGTIVYVNVGAKDGVLPGDEFAIVYPRTATAVIASELDRSRDALLRHPVTGDKLGNVMKMAGRLKIILLGEEVSTAEITYACDVIDLGSELYPFTEVPVPMVRRKDLETHFNEMAKRGRGFVVWLQDTAVTASPGQLLTIDLGSRDGIIPGDVFTVWRNQPTQYFQRVDTESLGSSWDYFMAIRNQKPRRDALDRTIYGKQRPFPDMPPRVIGRLVVLYTQPNTATAIALDGRHEFLTGDRIVYEAIDEGLVTVRKVTGNVSAGVPLSRQPGATLVK